MARSGLYVCIRPIIGYIGLPVVDGIWIFVSASRARVNPDTSSLHLLWHRGCRSVVLSDIYTSHRIVCKYHAVT